MNFPAPIRPFIHARYKGGRQKPKALVMHGTVSSDNAGTARNIANWWHGPTSPKTSCHYVTDPKEDIQCVGDHTVAFHCGYNKNTVGLEMCDEQQGPANRWDDKDSRAIIARTARLAAELCLAYNIHPRRPSISELKRHGPHGIYGHDDSRRAFGRTSHTDPRDFPWPVFIKQVKAEIAKIKRDTVPSKPSHRLRVAHVSLRWNLTQKQKNEDADAIFALGYDWITGTEAMETSGYKALLAAARKYGYTLYRPVGQDCWISVRLKSMTGRVYPWYSGTIIRGRKGKHSNLGLPAVRFKIRTPGVGWIGVGVSHYPTQRQDRNRSGARKIAGKINALARNWGKGPDLFFAGIDGNQSDRTTDPFFGGPLATCWDDMGVWPDTGHGNIDLIARHEGDLRVTCVDANVIGDSMIYLHGDHKIVQATYDVVLEK